MTSTMVDRRFDAALASARGWRQDALLYTGRRREVRLEHARRMDAIADRMVEAA